MRNNSLKNSHLYILISIAICFSCTDSSPDDLTGDAVVTATYNINIAPIVQSQCLSCHNNTNSSGGLSLENYSQVRQSTENGALIDRIMRDAGDSQIMPPNGQLPQASIDLILQWQEDGYLEN